MAWDVNFAMIAVFRSRRFSLRIDRDLFTTEGSFMRWRPVFAVIVSLTVLLDGRVLAGLFDDPPSLAKPTASKDPTSSSASQRLVPAATQPGTRLPPQASRAGSEPPSRYAGPALPDVEFHAVPFIKVIDILEVSRGGVVMVDWDRVERSGVDYHAPVTYRFPRTNGTDAVAGVLWAAQPNGSLAFSAGPHGIVISTPEGIEEISRIDARISSMGYGPDGKSVEFLFRPVREFPKWRDKARLADALDFLKDITAVNGVSPQIWVDWEVLRSKGVEPGSSVGVHLTRATGARALGLILNQTARDEKPIFVVGSDRRVFISMPLQLSAYELAVSALHEAAKTEPSRAVLRRTVQDSRFDRRPLENVLAQSSRAFGIRLVADWKALAAVGIDPQEPTTIDVTGMQTADAMALLLSHVINSRIPTTFQASGELEITVRAQMPHK